MNRRRIQFEGSLPCDPALIFEYMAKKFRKKSEQEHIDIMINNNLRNAARWKEYRKENNLQEQYYSDPWKMLNKSFNRFFNEIYFNFWFDEIYRKKVCKLEQEHIELIKKNKITSNRWLRYWKENNLKEQGYSSRPWVFFNQTAKQFFLQCK